MLIDEPGPQQQPQPQAGQELDLTLAGQHVRAKGYRLVDLIWLPLVLGIGYIGLTLYNHSAEAQGTAKTVADALKESNAQIAKVLKETSEQHTESIRAMAVEQKKATAVLQEMTCLLDPAMKGRNDTRDFCKRMTRDR